VERERRRKGRYSRKGRGPFVKARGDVHCTIPVRNHSSPFAKKEGKSGSNMERFVQRLRGEQVKGGRPLTSFPRKDTWKGKRRERQRGAMWTKGLHIF